MQHFIVGEASSLCPQTREISNRRGCSEDAAPTTECNIYFLITNYKPQIVNRNRKLLIINYKL